MKPTVECIILAAGNGVRFKRDKMAILIDGKKPYDIIFSEADKTNLFTCITTVGPDGHVQGGNTRRESIIAGMSTLSSAIASYTMVIDAARFLVSRDDIALLVSEAIANDVDACAFARKVTNSIVINSDLTYSSTNRADYFETHTPHIFKTEVLRYILKHTEETNYVDEFSAAVDLPSIKTMTVMGNWRTALKLTYPEDLAIMESLYHAQDLHHS